MRSIMRHVRNAVILALPAVLALSGCGGGGGAGGGAGEPSATAETGGSGVGTGGAPQSVPAQPGAAGDARVPAAVAAADTAATVVRGTPAWTGTDEEARQLIAATLTVRNNLKQIALGFHNHHDTFTTFLPPQIDPRAYDDQKRPRFSWRVALLPYLERADLYNQYNFDEPWDSEQNKKILNQMPDLFRTPGDEGTNTRYQIVVGPGSAFEPGQRETRIRDFRDGASNSLLVAHVGADKAVPWTKPEDVPFDPANVRAMFGDVGDTLPFVAVDGSVHAIRADAPEELLRNLITPSDGQIIDLAAVAAPPQQLPWLAEPPRSGPLAAAYMPDDGFGVVVFRPQRLMGSPLYQKAVTPEDLAQATANMPVDPKMVEEVVVWLAPPDTSDKEIGHIGGVAVRFTQPPAPDKLEEFIAGMSPALAAAPRHQADERTVLCGSQFRLYKLLNGKNPPALLSSRAVQTQGDVVALVDSSDGQLIQRVAGLLPPDSPDTQGILLGATLFLAPFANSNLIELNVDLSGENLLAVRTECKTPQDAVNFQQMITGFLLQARQQPQMTPQAGEFFDQLKITAEGTTGTVALPASEGLTAAILQGLRQVRSTLPTGRASGVIFSNNLKQVGLAYHMMYDEHRGIQPWAAAADRDAEGKPYLSWRVHFLPYLEQQELSSQFHLNEPWDSDHNRALLDQMPDVYRSAGGGDPTKTSILFLTGPQTVFDGTINGDFRKVIDGTSNTLLALIVPAEQAVPWTQPADAVFDPSDPLSVVRPVPPDGIRVLFLDGSVKTLPADIDAETFKALVTPAGRDPVSVDFVD